MIPQSEVVNAVALVLVATLGLSLKGIWARLAYASGLEVSGVMFYRAALSLPLLLVVWRFLGLSFRPARGSGGGDSVRSIVLGALFALGMWCDFQAIEALGAGVSRVILFGFPLGVMLIEAAVSRAWPAAVRLAGFALAWLGLCAVAGAPTGEARGGLSWAFASMLIYAAYVWCSERVSRRIGSARLTALSNLATSTVVLIGSLWVGDGAPPEVSPRGLWLMAAMVLLSTVGPYFLMMEGMRRLGSTEASLLAMLGPLATVLAGYWVLGERLSALQWTGMLATLLGVAIARGTLSRAELARASRLAVGLARRLRAGSP